MEGQRMFPLLSVFMWSMLADGETSQGSFSFPSQNAWGHFFVPSFPEISIVLYTDVVCVSVYTTLIFQKW